MKVFSIDINADVGEGIGNEAQLMPFLSSCNIACGGHAGDEKTMREVVQLALLNNVKIGAHPSFPDKEGFGRQVVDMSCAALYHTVKEQIEEIQKIAREEHALLHHVKPHGALYNLAAKDETTAEVIVEVMKRFHTPLKLYVPYGSVIAEIAKRENLQITYEAFADRNYNDDLTLVSRSLANAVIKDENELCQHVYEMIVHQKVKTIHGNEIPIHADTICVHGDNPKAINLVKTLYHFLNEHAVAIQ